MDPNTAGWVLIAALALPLGRRGADAAPAEGRRARIMRFAVLVTGVSFALVTAMTLAFDYGRSGELQFVTDVAWIDAINARFHLGIDGISLPLFFLSYLLPFLSAIYTTQAPAGAGQAQGLPLADAAPADRYGRDVRRVRPDPLLHLLRARPRPDVLHDRDVGWPAPRLRQRQVLPLHAVRLDLHARVVPRRVLPVGDCAAGTSSSSPTPR
jgi:hypothetical protein